MRLRKLLTTVIAILILQSSFSQGGGYLRFKPYKPYQWLVGAGWSFLDNDGRSHSHILNIKESWVANFYPSHLIVDKYLKHNFSLELDLSFNQFDGKKMVNEAFPTGLQFSADLHTRFSFYRFLQPTRWIDPYLGMGLGLTYIDEGTTNSYATANALVGVNFWINDVGIRLQGTAKLGLTGDVYYNNTNYIQYSAAVLYRFHGREKNNNNFNKPQHKWTRQKPKNYKGRSK